MNKKKLLVIDDDQLFLNVLKNTLEKHNYEVTECSDAQGARHLFVLSDFDAVISDIRLGGSITGIDLLKDFKKERSGTPFLLMTGFLEIIETIQADQLGADGFLPKPFRQENLLTILSSIFPSEQAKVAAPVLSDQDYMKLNINDFVSGKDIKYDIFVRLNSGRYIKIGNHGENIPKEQIQHYRSKGLNYLYLKREDFRHYLDFNLKLSSVIKSATNVSKEKKANFLRHTNELLLSHIFVAGVDKEAISETTRLLQTTLDVLTDDQEILALLSALNEHSDFLYAHSLAVSLYANLIATRLSYSTPSVLFKISFAALMHDIGKKEIDPLILKTPRNALTPLQIQIYESHPIRGMEIMSSVKSVTAEVLQVILQHHENCAGTGTPNRVMKAKIHPFAKIVGLSNDFAKLVMKGAESDGLTPEDALARLLIYPERYDRAAIIALMQIFHYPLPKEFDAKVA